MPIKPLHVTTGVAGFLVVAAVWINLACSSADPPQAIKSPRLEAEPLCPWREPDRDRREFFPEADAHDVETRILSGFRMELAQRLGRAPTAGENALRLYRVYARQQPAGVVMTSRVKGEYGAIEIVLAVDLRGGVRGWRLQRQREPEGVAAALQQAGWLGAFRGKTLHDPWQIGNDLPTVPALARTSAEAVVEGVRGLLIRLDVAGQSGAPSAGRHP